MKPKTICVAVDRDGNYINLSEGGARILEVHAETDLSKPVEQWFVWERYEIGRAGDEIKMLAQI